MKKSVSVLIACFLMIGIAKADGLLDFGIKGGVNFPSLNDGDIEWDAKTGFHAGARLRVNIPIVAVIGEVLYSETSFTSTETDDFKKSTIEVPIVGQISLLNIITIHAGPQFNFLTSSKVGDIDFKEQIDNNTFNFVAGAGVMLGKLDIHGRFVFPAGMKVTTENVTDEYKNSNIQLSVGYWF